MIYFCINTKLNRAEVLNPKFFTCFELVQQAFHVGLQMSDGNMANGIGRCRSMAEFVKKANHGKTTILLSEENDFNLEIEVNGTRAEVANDVWRSWTGRRWINGYECNGERFYWLSNDVAKCCNKNTRDCDCDQVEA